jgi:hypothetical protein
MGERETQKLPFPFPFPSNGKKLKKHTKQRGDNLMGKFLTRIAPRDSWGEN